MPSAIIFPSLARVLPALWALSPESPRGYIAGELPDGLVTVAGVPAARKVWVIHDMTQTVVGSTFSDYDGTWRIDGLPMSETYTVRGTDWTGAYKDQSENGVHPWPYTGTPPSYPHGDYIPPDGNKVGLNFDTYAPISSVIPYAVWTA